MSENKLEVNYDEGSDVLYLVTEKGVEEEFIELAPGINVELNEAGKVIGFEILNASQILGPMIKKLKRAGLRVL